MLDSAEELKREMLQRLTGNPDIRLSPDQEQALARFLSFVRSQHDYCTFLLTGSAGTGKTFLINLFSKILKQSGYQVILLAPTGRAAKVITKRTHRHAYTIHHHIYSVKENDLGEVYFELKPNKTKKPTVYIVDEASMIGDKEGGISGSLLKDLLNYAFHDNPSQKLILVGDPVQLPPVGSAESPALQAYMLGQLYNIDLYEAQLNEVLRQSIDSDVLDNAVRIRDTFLSNLENPLELLFSNEVINLDNAYESLETYLGYFQEGNYDRVIFITYSNWQSSKVNQAIRHRLFEEEGALQVSDLVMVVRNNYAWGDPKRLPFIANGEMGTVHYVDQESYEEKYGLKWIDAEIAFEDTRGEEFVVPCKVVLDLLDDKRPQLDEATMHRIWFERKQVYAELPIKESAALMRKDPYVNALQIKYGYCITGHKSQGGQWENVIIGFEPDYGKNPQAYMRWVYTVFTRAEERVFLLNCPFVEN